MELGGYSATHPFILATQLAENYSYKNCDAVISILPYAESHMREHGLMPGKFNHIPNGIVIDDWSSSIEMPAKSKDAIKLFRNGRFLIGYAGAHGIANALDNLIEAAALVPDVGFVLVGQGTEKDRLMEKARDLGNVLFLDPIPKKAIPSFLCLMDALFIGSNKSILYRYGTSPNKVFDYMMAGKPIINAMDGPAGIIEISKCGLTVPACDSEELAKVIQSLKAMDDATRDAMGRNGHAYILGNHNYTILASRFLDVMANLKKE